MNVERWCIGVVFAGAMLGVLLFFVAGSFEWEPPGTSAYDSDERANRILVIPWAVAAIAATVLWSPRVRHMRGAGRIPLGTGAVAGLLLIVAGNVTEFWALSETTYPDDRRRTAWKVFLLGHGVLLAAAVGYGILKSRERGTTEA